MTWEESATLLLVVGILMVVAGFLLLIHSAIISIPSETKISFGGAVLIGPIPVAFGGGPYGEQLAILALIIAVLLAIILMFFYLAHPRRVGQT